MNSKAGHLLEKIRELKARVNAQIKKREKDSLTKAFRRRRFLISKARPGPRQIQLSALQSLREASPSTLLTAPVIYGFFLGALVFDFSISLAQAILFPFYQIQKVRRANYIGLDRHHLPYLNWIEKLNCDYCGYVNGLIAYAREVASRVEQYFCPIRHALHLLGLHPRFEGFLPYGEALDFHAKLSQFRAELREAEALGGPALAGVLPPGDLPR